MTDEQRDGGRYDEQGPVGRAPLPVQRPPVQNIPGQEFPGPDALPRVPGAGYPGPAHPGAGRTAPAVPRLRRIRRGPGWGGTATAERPADPYPTVMLPPPPHRARPGAAAGWPASSPRR